MAYLLNPAVRRDRDFAGLFRDDEYRDVAAYYDAHPDLSRTPLSRAGMLANSLGLATVDIKDESGRFGVTAFKIVGVRYAVHRLGDVIARGLVCATAGNHGCAVARVANERRVPCTIFVPAARDIAETERATRDRRIAAMTQDGATVVEIEGSYENAVRRAAAFGERAGATIVSDVSWPGYETIPRWIMAGYTHIFEEASAQWDRIPGLVVVQGGVGGLVCAAASWFAWRFRGSRPFIIACEPENAACLLESARAGAAVSLSGGLNTIMAGLRCGEPSPAAWPAIAAGIDAFVSISDARTLKAMHELRQEHPPIAAGPSGACGVAALRAVATAPEFASVRSAARLDSSTRALAIVSEAP